MGLNKFLLPLNLQFFSADPQGGAGSDPQGTDPNNAGGTDPQTTPQGAVKTFTQEEVDALIKERLAREKRKADEKADEARKEAERKALEEQGKYKEMYDEILKDLATQKAEALVNKKHALLIAEGYTKEQAERYVKFVEGETDEELATAITTLKADIPPTTKYVDPASAGNTHKQDPTPTSAYDEAKELIKRLRGKK